MKFKTIAQADVAIIREARRTLKRLQKRINSFDEKRQDALRCEYKDYVSIATEEWRLLDELNALNICIDPHNCVSLKA